MPLKSYSTETSMTWSVTWLSDPFHHSVLRDKIFLIKFVVVVQSFSHAQLFVTPWTAAHQVSLSLIISQNLLKFTPIESVIPSNHLILYHPLLHLPLIFPSIRIFSSKSALRIRWPKYWSFSFNISPSNEHTELISFWMNWLDLLAVQGSLRSLLWHDSSKASLPGLSFPYSPTLTSTHDYWKNYSLDYMDLCGQGNISAF